MTQERGLATLAGSSLQAGGDPGEIAGDTPLLGGGQMAGALCLLQHLVDSLEARCDLLQLGVRRRLEPSFRLQVAELRYKLTAALDHLAEVVR